jgi:hypothetical protein
MEDVMRRLSLYILAVALIAGCNSSNTPPVIPPAPQFLIVGNCAGSDAITVYPAAVTGDTAPTRTITDATATLTCSSAVAMDSAGDIFASEYTKGKIFEFAPGANGSSTPIHVITTVPSPLGVNVGPDGNTYVGSLTPTLYVFAPGADAAATPVRTFSVAGAGMSRAEYPTFDALGNLWLSDETSGIVAAFSATATGTPTPIHKIFGTNTGFNTPYGLDFDTAGELLVADYNIGSVWIFGPTQDGNVTPARAINGLLTTFQSPLVVHTNRAGTIFVSDGGANAVLIFASNANGNMAPIGKITTGISNPWGMALH